MKTKLLSILVMLSMLISFTVLPTSAAGALNLSASDATAQPGEEVTVTVSVTSNPGVVSMMFEVGYDSNLTLVNVSLSSSFGTVTTPPQHSNPQRIGMMSPVSNVTTTGDIATLTFKVSENAPVGYVANISISYSSGDFYDVDFNPVSVSATGGSVTVVCRHENTTDMPEEPASCNQGGYTAGVYCNTCKTYISGHEPTNPTGQHVDSDGLWETDENNHYHTCTCGQVFDTGAHAGGTATCIKKAVCGTCGKEYGAVNPDNHAGQTTLINASEANHNTQTSGYSGDTQCNDCGQIITYGQTIAPSAHTPASTWSTDGTNHWKVCSVSGCDYVFEDTKAAHSSTGTNQANCQRAAICDHCGETYGSVASHSYTAETKSSDTLKTAGDCSNAAVYYYSCSGCGAVERNDAHTFTGDKDPSKHVGGTETVNASEADHKTQTSGYTGDVKCLGCGETITYGQAINPTPHEATWQHDETKHWQICTVSGCGIVIDGSTADHRSTGKNIATCKQLAICDDCGVSYGQIADHNWATSWSSDETGHWHDCVTGGCSETIDFAAHDPDHVGGATEEYAIRCFVCRYVIEAQLAHPHVYDKEIATDEYKATDATCSAKATYYKSCACGEKGTETFEYGDLAEHAFADATCTEPKTCTACGATEGQAAGHVAGGEWQKDGTSHWQLCTVEGCGAIVEETKAQHTPDHEGGATEEYPVRCTVCLYIIEAQLAHPHVYDQQIATGEYKATDADCTNRATYYKSCKCGDKGTETFEYGDLADHSWTEATCTEPKTCTVCGATEGEAKGHTASGEWNRDKDNHWQICAIEGCGAVIEETLTAHTPDRSEPTETEPVKCSVCEYMITPELSHAHSYEGDWQSDENNHWKECVCGDKTAAESHVDEDKDGNCDVCAHEVAVPDVTDPVEKDHTLLWIILACAVILIVIVIIIIAKRKKKSA